jgi:hypothetical protein
MRRIDLPVGGIMVLIETSGKGHIRSKLKLDPVRTKGNAVDVMDYNHGVEAIERLILAHALLGIKINSPNYIKGVEIAVESLAEIRLDRRPPPR